MNSEQVWKVIISRLSENEIELPTVPKIKRNPVWFSAKTDGNVIYINKATKNKPSMNL